MTRKHKPQNEQCLSLSPNPTNTHSAETSVPEWGSFTDTVKKGGGGKSGKNSRDKWNNGKEGREGLGSTQGPDTLASHHSFRIHLSFRFFVSFSCPSSVELSDWTRRKCEWIGTQWRCWSNCCLPPHIRVCMTGRLCRIIPPQRLCSLCRQHILCF
jgi:hypothetical protein